MKNLLITTAIMAIFLSIPSTAYNVYLAFGEKTYCDGFKKGYVAGYCFEDPFCIKPIVPICPIPVVNFNTYKDGYQRGFKAGIKDREKEDN
jgi:hypothetical protein